MTSAGERPDPVGSATPADAAQLEVARRRSEIQEVRAVAERVREARRRGCRRLVAAFACTLVVGVSLLVAGSTSRGPLDKLSSTRPSSRDPGSAFVVAPALHATLSSLKFPGKPAALPLPKIGEGAVVVAGVGVVGDTKDEKTVPIASVTKIMTAYLVLQDHPLVGNNGGPVFTMTAADHEAWIEASEADESNIEVVAGERLDERQLLQALMIPSANNIADYLAVWDAGSLPKFVAKMNATAKALGLTNTSYADASGFDPKSRSDASDMAKLAAIAMQNPELRWIVDEQSIRLPVAGEIWNLYNPAVGVDGIIGVKSGFTSSAQSNLVTAAWRRVGGHRVLVISAVIDQPLSLYSDALEDEALLNAATTELAATAVVPAQAQVAQAVAGWNHSQAAVSIDSPAVVVGWPGMPVSLSLVPIRPAAGGTAHGWPEGSTIGMLEIRAPFGAECAVPAVLGGAISAPPPGWQPASSTH